MCMVFIYSDRTGTVGGLHDLQDTLRYALALPYQFDTGIPYPYRTSSIP